MIIHFAEVKSEQKKLDNLIDTFISNFKSLKISKSQMYADIFSAIFFDMRKQLFTDSDIDEVLCQAIGPVEPKINYVNNNRKYT